MRVFKGLLLTMLSLGLFGLALIIALLTMIF